MNELQQSDARADIVHARRMLRSMVPDDMPANVVAIVSGGLDSVTLLHLLASLDVTTTMIAFDYGQRHSIELPYAFAAARRLGIPPRRQHLITWPPDLAKVLFGGSALTEDEAPVPEGHYAAESMKATIVPNRNAVMLSLATALAVRIGAVAVAAGFHSGDHFIYPDCRPTFVEAFGSAMRLGNEGSVPPTFGMYMPFLDLTKAEIVGVGSSLGSLNVPYSETWSCYSGGARHCGTCGTCNERREAFQLSGIVDPTWYDS